MKPERVTAVRKWLKTNPHLNESGELVNKASLLEICLGLGILLDDAQLALFTEDDDEKEMPHYISGSVWDPSDYDQFTDYANKLQMALWEYDEMLRLVHSVG